VINRELPVWQRRKSVWSRDCDHVTDAVWLLLLVVKHHTGLPEGSVLRRVFGLTAPATHTYTPERRTFVKKQTHDELNVPIYYIGWHKLDLLCICIVSVRAVKIIL